MTTQFEKEQQPISQVTVKVGDFTVKHSGYVGDTENRYPYSLGPDIIENEKLAGVIIGMRFPEFSIDRLVQVEGFDLETITKEVSRVLEIGCKDETKRNKLLSTVMASMPEFVQMTDLWEVKSNNPDDRTLKGAALGSIVKLEPAVEGYRYGSSSLAVVMKEDVARARGIPGTPIPGPVTVYWPKDQVEYANTSTRELKFGNPPLLPGTRVLATISTHADNGAEVVGNENTMEGKHWKIVIPDVPADEYEITHYVEDGIPQQNENYIGTKPASWMENQYLNGSYRLWIINLDGTSSRPTVPLNGNFAVEIAESKTGLPWYMVILTPEYLNQEREHVLNVIKSNRPLLRYAQPIPGHVGKFGMPVDDQGVPCQPENAQRWVMYERIHPWKNSYPEASIIGSLKGFRSKSEGSTFAKLVEAYTKR